MRAYGVDYYSNVSNHMETQWATHLHRRLSWSRVPHFNRQHSILQANDGSGAGEEAATQLCAS